MRWFRRFGRSMVEEDWPGIEKTLAEMHQTLATLQHHLVQLEDELSLAMQTLDVIEVHRQSLAARVQQQPHAREAPTPTPTILSRERRQREQAQSG